jgi:hypothetical protein
VSLEMFEFMVIASGVIRAAADQMSPRELFGKQCDGLIAPDGWDRRGALQELRLLGILTGPSNEETAQFSNWGRGIARLVTREISEHLQDLNELLFPILVEI